MVTGGNSPFLLRSDLRRVNAGKSDSQLLAATDYAQGVPVIDQPRLDLPEGEIGGGGRAANRRR